MKFKREFLAEEVLDDDGLLIEDKVTGKSRWSVHHRIVFKAHDKFWSTTYSVGATEQQEERPWQDQEEVECVEVVPVQKMITVYESVK